MTINRANNTNYYPTIRLKLLDYKNIREYSFLPAIRTNTILRWDVTIIRLKMAKENVLFPSGKEICLVTFTQKAVE